MKTIEYSLQIRPFIVHTDGLHVPSSVSFLSKMTGCPFGIFRIIISSKCLFILGCDLLNTVLENIGFSHSGFGQCIERKNYN